MAKLSRSAFFSILAGASVLLLTGCGANTKENSNFSGVYRSAYTISSLSETGSFNFTVDVKGNMSGSFAQTTVSTTGTQVKVREFHGEVKNNGEFTGTTTLNDTAKTTGFVSGKVGGAGGTVVTEGTGVAIVGGDFTLAENDQKYAGSFSAGTTTTQ